MPLYKMRANGRQRWPALPLAASIHHPTIGVRVRNMETSGGEAMGDPQRPVSVPTLRGVKRILAPTDFSGGADRALSVAIDAARLLGAVLEIVYVHNASSYVTAVPFAEPAFLPLTGEERSSVDEALARMAERARASGASCLANTLIGNPAHEIVEYARRQAIDLIVMGTHGRTGFKHVLFGSVAERVVQRAACPVLVVPLADRQDRRSEPVEEAAREPSWYSPAYRR
jgi:universal stress protein A